MASLQGGNRELYKKKNRGLLLKLLMTGACSSRIELSKTMGLTKMTITNIVNELIDCHILEDSDPDQNLELGRNPVRLKLSKKAPKVIGLLIFRDRCEAVLSDLQLNVLKKETIRYTDLTKELLEHYIYQVIDCVYNRQEQVVGIGVSAISPIDIEAGLIINPEFFYGIENMPIVSLLSNKYNLPIYYNNDNQNGVLAEKLFGNGKLFHDILLIGIGEGVGCGIIADGRLFLSYRQLIPEFGHISIDYNGKTCACGRKGCIESYINTSVLTSAYEESTGKALSFKSLCQEDSSTILDTIFYDAMDKLASAVTNIVNVMNTELVILGHEGVYIPDQYLNYLKTRLNQQRFRVDSVDLEVVKPLFMADAQLLGAACGVINEVFTGLHLFD